MSSPAEVSTPVNRVVLAAGLLGLAASATVTALAATLWADVQPTLPSAALGLGSALVLSILLTAGGQLTHVRVRHGDTWEELAFLEVAVAVAILLLSPVNALWFTLSGLFLAELLIRRGEWLKIIYNLGSFAAASSAMIATYHVLLDLFASLAGPGAMKPTSGWSMVSLVVASAVFTAVNLLLLAALLRATTGAPPRQVLDEEWRLSELMAIGSVGMGFMAVALAFAAPWALPFTALPALAMWYAYLAAAQHAAARERNRWLVTLGGLLAQHGRGDGILDESAEAIRQIVGAPEAFVLHPMDPSGPSGDRLERVLTSTWSDPGPRALAAAELPHGWQVGVVTRLDLGTANPGALLLGSTEPYRPSKVPGRSRGWSLPDADVAVLGALVAAVGSAMRAGTAFDALTEETEKLTAVVDNTSDGIAVIDESSGQVRRWSRTMAWMTGVPAVTLPQDPAEAPVIVRTLVEAARAVVPGSPPTHVHLVRSDGEALDISLSVARVREATAGQRQDAGWVRILSAHDETRERRVERMKTDFVASISHELRTPITPIKGYASLLLSPKADRLSPERREQALRVISDRADHMERLVEDLLMASKQSEKAHYRIEPGVEDVAGIVSEAVAGFPQLAARLTIRPPEAPLQVVCDRMRALQCLTNLLTNAEKYADGQPVEVSVHKAGRRAAIHVRDHGRGIPMGEHDRVFERFYRREDPFTMQTGGAGLGLAIARELAVAMGGALTLRPPAAGTGAEFVLELPLAPVPSDSDAEGVTGALGPGQHPAGRVGPSAPRPSEARPDPRKADDTTQSADPRTPEPPTDGTIAPTDDRIAAS